MTDQSNSTDQTQQGDDTGTAAAAATIVDTTDSSADNTGTTTTAATTQSAVEITDDILVSELGKRYGDRIKSKSDLERVLSFNESDYIKPTSELVKKLNDWGGDPETFIQLSKLDVDKMEPKEAIIRDTMIRRGISREDAELVFNDRYKNAFSDEQEVDFDAQKKRLAELDMADAAKSSKAELSKYKVSELDKGKTQPTEQQIAEFEANKKKNWDDPIESALAKMDSIESSISIRLSDEQEVKEVVKLGTDNQDTRAFIKDLFSDPDQIVNKFLSRYAVGATPEEGFRNLFSKLYALENSELQLSTAASVGAAKALEAHLKHVRPGSVGNPTNAPANTQVSIAEALAAAMKEKQDAMMNRK